MPEYAHVAYVVGSMSVLLLALDLYTYAQTSNAPRTLRTLLQHSTYLIGSLVLYAVVGWVVAIPFPNTKELVYLFTPQGDGVSTVVTYPHLALALALALVLSFYAGSFADYVIHRWFSHTKPFWWTHEYHHVPRVVMLAMPGIAVRPFSFFLTIPTVLLSLTVYTTCLGFFHLPLVWYGAFWYVLGVHACILLLAHSLYARSHPSISAVLHLFGITTPQEHILHHAAYVQGNYGNLSMIWDRMFGTYLDPKHYRAKTLPIGVAYPQDFIGAVTFDLLHVPTRYVRSLGVDLYTNTHAPAKTEIVHPSVLT